MTHARIRRLFDGYLDGTLDAVGCSRVEAHVAECASCAVELVELRRVRALLRQLGDPEPPPDFAERVLARIAAGEAAARGGRLESAWRRLPVLPLALAAGVAGLFWVVGNAPEALLPLEPAARSPAVREPARQAAAREMRDTRQVARSTASVPRPVWLPGAASARPAASDGRPAPDGTAGAPASELDELLTSQLALALADVDAYAVELVALPAAERGHRIGRLAEEALRRRAVPDLRRALLLSRRAETLHILRELDRELRARVDEPAPRPFSQGAAIPVAAPR